MSEIVHAINWEWLAPIIGCFVFAGFLVVLFMVSRATSRLHSKYIADRRGEIWADLQNQIDAYRKPDGATVYTEFARYPSKETLETFNKKAGNHEEMP